MSGNSQSSPVKCVFRFPVPIANRLGALSKEERNALVESALSDDSPRSGNPRKVISVDSYDFQQIEAAVEFIQNVAKAGESSPDMMRKHALPSPSESYKLARFLGVVLRRLKRKSSMYE